MPHSLWEEKIWGDSRFEPGLTPVIAQGEKLIGIAMGVVLGNDLAALKLIAVHPSHHRQGVGTQLMEYLENQLRERGQQRWVLGASPPNYLWPGLDPGYTAGSRFFDKAGFHWTEETVHMTVSLLGATLPDSNVEVYLEKIGCRVRRAKPKDRENVRSCLSEIWPSWAVEVDSAFEQSPISLHLAWEDETIVGFSAYDCNNLGIGWFGPMGTLETHRKLGLGRLLLRRCLADLAEQGKTSAVIPWVGPIAFYRHAVGAQVARRFICGEKELKPHNPQS